MKKILYTAFVSFILPAAALALGGNDSPNGMMDSNVGYGMMGYGGGWFGGFFMFAYSAIFLIIGVLVIVWLWQQINKK